MIHLKGHWCETFSLFSHDLEFRNICYNNIINLYSEKNRYYHGLDHISACLEELENYNRHQLHHGSIYCDDVRIRLAIWLHDVIYNTTCSNNEENSAEFAKMVLVGGKIFDEEIIKDVSDLILLTKHNGSQTYDFAGKLLLDIDLSILGKDREIFNKYESDIRKEYSWVEDNLFNEARLRIVDGFLSRDKIYQVGYFYDLYESVARENLKYSRELLLSKIG